jgi:hypothetical protein
MALENPMTPIVVRISAPNTGSIDLSLPDNEEDHLYINDITAYGGIGMTESAGGEVPVEPDPGGEEIARELLIAGGSGSLDGIYISFYRGQWTLQFRLDGRET